MNYRGRTVKLVQANTQSAIPFLISTANYGLLWDNYSKTIFADDPDHMSLWSEVGDNLDYYFVCGKNMDAAIAGYRDLTGQAPMYGKWASSRTGFTGVATPTGAWSLTRRCIPTQRK
jgi:alpha-D-xyloside xylohydrolase